MQRRTVNRAGAAALALLLAGPAAAMEARASYVVSLSGVNIAAVHVDLTDDGRQYSLNLAADVAGLGQLVASGTANIQSAGTVSGSALAPQRFALRTRANEQDFSVRVEFAQGDVTAFVVDPPLTNNFDRVPIERAHLQDVTDMLSAFVIKGGALDQALCSRKAKIFTGLERFDVAMRFAGDDAATSPRTGYQGPVILCSVRYVPVSGHFTTSEMTAFLAQSDRILIWYAPLEETGYFIPYRVLLTTSIGDLSLVLTAMRS